MDGFYQRAWELFRKRMLEHPRARWSNTRLLDLMIQCLLEAGRDE